AGVRVVVPDGDDPAAEVADVPVAIVRAEMGVAESGSLLISEHTLGDRVVTMLCHRLIQVVEAADVVERLESAAEWLAVRSGQPGFASLMTGPSRTADIERSLTIGVQGPDEVDVLVLTATDPTDLADPSVTTEENV
ncbi:MAG: lactate utilization protein C, partial [Halomonas sp.]